MNYTDPIIKKDISSDDKLISLIAHLSSIFGSIILPLILYFVYKDKSKFVAFNALQALFFQIMCYILWVVLSVGFMAILVGIGLFKEIDPSYFSEDVLIQEIVFFGFTFLFFLLQGIYAVFIGIKSYKGEIAKYFPVGNFAYRKVYPGKGFT